MRSFASGLGRPSNAPELTSTSSAVWAENAPVSGSSPSAGATTGTHLDPVALCECVVALVVRRHGHDRARAVSHQHVVGHPDRDGLTVDRVDRETPREDPVLLLLLPFHLGARGRSPHVIEHRCFVLGARDELRHQRVLRREDEERGTEQRVRPGREDGQLLPALRDAEDDAGTV